jgi:ABC-type ATPase with predicted acetyltransferase domain
MNNFCFDNSKACISQFDCEVEKVTEVFNAVGFSSVPVWLHRPCDLSNGERARLEIASKLLTADNHVIYIDEFTSVVDRNVAKSIAKNVASYARKYNLKLVIASCHFDIIDYLNPDYIFNLNKKINGHTQLEHFVYTDNYNVYANVDKSAILSEIKEVI